jgi:putative membrane-bound dehydrogenase-like protein
MFSKQRFSLITLALLGLPADVRAQKEFGFDNTKTSGQPYLSPEESLRQLQAPPGFEVKLFAAEPDIINPIAFSIDERGRLWVVECYEYPKKTPKGQKPRDRIKILEDTTGSGKADKVTIWAAGKDLPIGWDLTTGIEVGHGGVFLGAAPYLFFLSDTSGQGRCDKQEILLSGFGSQDTHETLNTFQWGPDGLLYGLHGIFTQSKVGEVRLNAAVWRYNPCPPPPVGGGKGGGRFDIFAEGTSNPWGLDFDPHGQAFLTACVIPHAFHIIPGGSYIRQDGRPDSYNHPYSFGLLREICDHTHHAESGWAHAGALILQGDHIPEDLRGSLLMGSIHGCVIKRDTLERRGSTFVARHTPDFLKCGDKNFRPINMRWGPDGSIYVIDWHDQNPCHQADPDSWDMTHGRIYKIQRIGTKSEPPGDLAKKSSRELVQLLKNNSPWWHRTALRLLNERHDKSVVPLLEDLLLHAKDDMHSLRALWGLFVVGAFDESIALRALQHASPWVRSWTVRLLGEGGHVSGGMLAKFVELAKSDPAPEVRVQLAATAQRLVDKDTVPLLHALMQHAEDANDPCIPLMIWLAYEPRVATQSTGVLAWLKENGSGNLLVVNEIIPRVMRRLVASNDSEKIAACITFLGEITDSAARRRALEGLVQAFQGRQLKPPSEWQNVFRELEKNRDADIRRLAHRMAVTFGDRQVVLRSLSLAEDPAKQSVQRIDAIRDLALAHPSEALKPLQQLVQADSNLEVRTEACRALGSYENPEVAQGILASWKEFPPALRGEAVNLLAGRKNWARELLAAVGEKKVPRADLTNNTILRIRAFHDNQLNQQIEAVWGKVRETPAELNLLINKMRAELNKGRASPERGRKVFENQCSKCHKFEGQGHDVGPNLDGAARDIDYQLVNILDPNRVIGQPYFIRTVERKDGRVETGILAAEDDSSVTLKSENDALKVIPKKDIEQMSVQEKSLMPEGLANNMTVQDFRDLIRYLMVNPFLTEVALAGPFLEKEKVEIDPAASNRPPVPSPTSGGRAGRGGGEHPSQVTWSQPVVGPAGRIGLPEPKGEGTNVAWIAAEVTAPGSMHTRLQLGAGHPVQAWLNGKSIYHGNPGVGPAAPDQAGVEVNLKSGANHLLFRVSYQGKQEAFYARLLDPQRKLKYPEAKK